MSIPLVEVTRGHVVECIHRGDIAVTDSSGNILAIAGDPKKFTFLRSAAKPLQALPVFTSGAYERFCFTPEEIAIMCSSHYAEPFHLNSVRSILQKIGLSEQHILGGTVTSLNDDYALQLAWDNVKLTPLFSDCSGKHAGMLAVCVHMGFDLDSYLQDNHPCQIGIQNALAAVCDIDVNTIQLGIDGCSAPVHAMPLTNMAIGFARLANSSYAPVEYRSGAEHIFSAMTTSPEMVSGTGGFCTELMRLTEGKLIGKVGAEGVYCVGVKDKNIGIAIKIENGNMAMLPPVVIRVLEQLRLLDTDDLSRLERYRHIPNRNDVKSIVGDIYPVFKLTP